MENLIWNFDLTFEGSRVELETLSNTRPSRPFKMQQR
jgi:hypothetical protein